MSDLDAILIIECGPATEAETLRAWSQLVKSGVYRSLQGSYQRGVARLIDAGYLDAQGNILVELDE
jgi:hypothetical protein